MHTRSVFFVTPYIILVALFLLPQAAAAFSGAGTGASDNPFQITTCSELQEMSSALSSYYRLENDIDCSATTGWNSGAGFMPIGTNASPFTGDLNGNGYAISDLYISRSSTDYVGLIGRANGADVYDLTLTNGNVSGRQEVGMLMGKLDGNGTVQRINYTGTTTSSSYNGGGLIGEILGGTLQYATSTNIVLINTLGSCCSYAGGVVGYLGTATVSDIYASSTVIATNSGRAGGLFGETNGRGGTGVTIKRVYGQVAVTSPASGGFIGFAYGSSGAPLTIENAGVRGISGGSSAAGGFAYTTYASITFTNVYSAVIITSSSKGGFQYSVTNTPTITSSYWNSQIAGTVNATGSGSLAGQDLTATTTIAMQTQTTYSGWDFSTIWGIDPSVNGGYPYIIMTPPDTTAPTVSITTPTSGEATSTTMTITASASDNRSVSGVSFYIDGTKQGSEDASSPYSISYDTTATSSGSHTVFAVARDSSDNYATSTSVTFTTSNTPTPLSVSVSVGTTTATTTWATTPTASSRVWIGLSSTYSTSTSETDTSPRVTSHTASFSGLKSCTKYHYAVTGSTTGGDVATSTDATFYTTGCTGDASISGSNDDSITTASGGSLTQGDLTLTVPTSFTSTSSAATFQINQIDSTAFFAAASRPSGYSSVGSGVFHLTALTDATTTLSTFDATISITLSYTASDVATIDETTLKIYRYDGTDWFSLSNCSVDTGARTVTCDTSAFSDFALFGSPSASSSSRSPQSSNGSSLPWCSGPLAPGWNMSLPDGGCGTETSYVPTLTASTISALPSETEASTSTEDIVSVTFDKEPEISITPTFNRNLRANSIGSDVHALQRFLNKHGFPLAPKGVGSLGNETDFFGPMTYNALILFQEAHAAAILTPLGLTHGTGIFGKSTRTFINDSYKPVLSTN